MRRIRPKKRGLPDWIANDSPDEEETSDASSSIPVKPQNDTHSSKIKTESGEIADAPKTKKPFSRPNYEYLPGNKQAQQNKGGIQSADTKDEATTVFESFLTHSLPVLTYKDTAIYSYNAADCSIICEEIMRTVFEIDGRKELPVGFDIEWPVTFTKGGGSGRVALVQLALHEKKCYLFHVSAMGKFPKQLKNLIEDDRVKKIGVNIESDLWKLDKDFDIDARTVIKKSMIDLGKLANKKLKSRENWSLEGLCRNVLKMRMNKDETVRCGQWDDFPLSNDQKLYAATDAHVCLRLYNTLVKDTI